MSTGRRKLLQCLLSIHSTLNSSEPYYVLNNLYITDYCVWIQKTRFFLITVAPRYQTLYIYYKYTYQYIHSTTKCVTSIHTNMSHTVSMCHIGMYTCHTYCQYVPYWYVYLSHILTCSHTVHCLCTVCIVVQYVCIIAVQQSCQFYHHYKQLGTKFWYWSWVVFSLYSAKQVQKLAEELDEVC